MASVQQYIGWCEQRMARLVVSEGLQVGLLGVTQGPLTLTYRVRLMQPQPAALRRLLSLGPALSQALQVGSVRIAEQPGWVAIEIPSPVQRTPAASELARHTSGLVVAVGFDAMRRPVCVDLRQHGAIFWIGPSRRGKTQSLKATLFGLARANGRRVQYAILSQKSADWQPFAAAAGCMGIVSEPAEALSALRWASSLLHQRAAHGTGGAVFVVVADDLLNLLSAEPAIAEPLAEIASMGAGLGVHLLAGTQEGGSRRGTGGAGVEANATARILYRSASAAGAARATGGGAEGLQALSGSPGDALLLVDGESRRVATGRADDTEILLLEQGAQRLARPWRHQCAPVQAPPAGSAIDGAHVGQTWAGGQDGAQSAGLVQPGAAPLLAGEPGTTEQRELVREVYARLGSKNAASKALWGHKSSRTYAWLDACLSDAESATDATERADSTPETPQASADDTGALSLDLATTEGQQVLATLQRAGLLPRDTISAVVRHN